MCPVSPVLKGLSLPLGESIPDLLSFPMPSCPLRSGGCLQEQVHEQGLHHQLTVGQNDAWWRSAALLAPDSFSAPPLPLEIAGPSVILSYKGVVAAFFIKLTPSPWLWVSWPACTPRLDPSPSQWRTLSLNQYLGFLCRAAYWARRSAFSIGAELVAAATYMTYWLPAVPGEIWVIVFSALLLLVNLRASVGSFPDASNSGSP